jgi:hypothetical protein
VNIPGMQRWFNTENIFMSFTLHKYKLKGLDIRPETLKIGQERVGNILKLKDIGNDFLNRTPMA